MMRRLFIAAMGMLVLLTGCSPVVIQPSEVGVIFDRFTGNLGEPLISGTHFINPLTEEVTIYSTDVMQLTLAGDASEGANNAVEVRFADDEVASIDATVLYAINSEMVNAVHSRWWTRYPTNFVSPTMRAVIRDVATGYSAETVLYERDNFSNDIRERMRDALEAEGFILWDFIIRNIHFSEAFSIRMELRAIATYSAAQTATSAARTATFELPQSTPAP